uniref:methylated diphthine methylhydrolase n=2 Tax=Macrostomum lignano TaxID=282301 RepID=A0A1I8FTV5_9PLAT
VAASYSTGHCALLEHPEHQEASATSSSWLAHDLEAWVCQPSRWSSQAALSGGDDCRLKLWDRRSAGACSRSLRHDAGVTMIVEHPTVPYLFLSGSYDESVRVWDTRALGRPVHSLSVGGGVWRLKWSACCQRLLCAAMYNGFKVLAFSSATGLQLLEEFNSPHSSIAYGADWVGSFSESDRQLVATCSFYDHLLCLWSHSF